MNVRTAWFVAAATLLTVGPCAAEPLAPPSGEVVLTVTGAIDVHNAAAAAAFDLGLLATLGEAQFRSTTIWTEGEREFSGTPLKALLDRLGVEGGTLRAIALNDYQVEIPVADVTETAPLLAWQIDGTTLTPRNRGPIWVVYPYDSDPAYRTDLIYARSIWQLTHIDVRAEDDG